MRFETENVSEIGIDDAGRELDFDTSGVVANSPRGSERVEDSAAMSSAVWRGRGNTIGRRLSEDGWSVGGGNHHHHHGEQECDCNNGGESEHLLLKLFLFFVVVVEKKNISFNKREKEKKKVV